MSDREGFGEIVRDLTVADPIARTEHGELFCALCGSEQLADDGTVLHWKRCVYARACELLAGKARLIEETGDAAAGPVPTFDADDTIRPPPDFDALERAFHNALPQQAQHIVGDLGEFFRWGLLAAMKEYVRSLRRGDRK